MIAVQIDSEKAIPIVSSTCPRDFDKRWVNHVWIRWSDGIDRSPYPRRSVTRTSKTSSRKRELAETAYYKPFQPNPRNNYIGDCVVRAISGAMDITWSKAIDLLSTMREVTVNAREVYPRVLEKHGFVHHNPLMKNGRRLDGKAFCEEMNRVYHNEERIFAHVGRSHVAAIVLVSLDDRSRSYKIIDSWDSSDRLIGEYWVLAKKSSKTNLVASAPVGEERPRQTGVGSKLHHPSFGDGVVIQTASGVLTIDFGDNGTRQLGEDWVIKNCSVVVENAGQAEMKVAHNKR